MAYKMAVPLGYQFEGANGAPLVGGTIEFYITGTSTPTPIYFDSAGSASATSVTLNALGQPQTSGGTAAALFFDDSVTYKLVRKDAEGSTIDPTFDPFNVVNSAGGQLVVDSVATLYGGDYSTFSYAETQAFTAGGSVGGSKWYKGASGGTQTTAGTLYTHLALGYVVDAGGNYWHLVPGQRIDLYKFGAVGDGSTDDRVSIQAALDYAYTVTPATVYIPDAVFVVSNTAYTGSSAAGVMSLLIRDGVRLRGDSLSATIKLEDSAFGPGAYGRVITSLGDSGGETGLINSGLYNFTIDGNSSNQIASVQYSNILLEASANVSVENVRSINSNGQGIMLRGQTSALAAAIKVLGCSVGGATGIGIQCSQFAGCIITHNYVDGCDNNAIDIYGDNGTSTSSTHNWVIANNVCRNSLTGIFPETVRDGIVANNTILNCTYGVHVNRINGDPENISIRGNNAQNCTIAYWHTGDNTMVVWAENEARNCETGLKAGNTTAGNASGCIAYNNVFQECTTALNVTCNNGSYLKLFNNYGRGNTAWKSVTVAGTSTNVIVDEESDFSGIYHPNAWRYLGANSTSNVVNVPVYFKDSAGAVQEFGKLQWGSSTVTAGSKGSTFKVITKNANSEVTTIEARQANVLLPSLPTSSAGLPSGALWNNSGVINIV